MRAGFLTLGCKLNQSETEALADAFRRAGHTSAGADDEADLYILNTCTVTSKSEQKARRALRRIAGERPGAPLILTGCYAEMEKLRLEREFGRRVFVVGLQEKALLLDLPAFLSGAESCVPAALEAFFAAGRDTKNGKFRFTAARYSFHTRAFLKIQDGCNNRCSYCRVCLARGPSVSLEAEEVLHRVRNLEAEGYREIVLTGVNLMSYASGKTGFGELLEKILNAPVPPGVSSARLRISSLEPEGITQSLARTLSHPRVCPHFHLPLQSGSDCVLRAMARRYTRARAEEAVGLLRAARPGAFIAADLISGFPGETEEDHAHTESLVRKLELASLHVFPFSRRPGTPAWNMKNRVPERVSRERASALRELSAEGWARYAKRLAGGRLELIIEKETSGGEWEGLSENYMTARVRGDFSPGSLVSVKVTALGKGFVNAEVCPEN